MSRSLAASMSFEQYKSNCEEGSRSSQVLRYEIGHNASSVECLMQSSTRVNGTVLFIPVTASEQVKAWSSNDLKGEICLKVLCAVRRVPCVTRRCK